jgi:hypothetical protein
MQGIRVCWGEVRVCCALFSRVWVGGWMDFGSVLGCFRMSTDAHGLCLEGFGTVIAMG